MKVKREELLQALESVLPGIAPKEIVEQSSAFVFKGGRVLTYNDEVSCRCPSPFGKEITGAVRSERLLDVLRKLPDDEIDAEAKDGKLTLRGKGRRTWVIMEADITLPVDAVERPTEWRPLADDFLEAVSTVQRCAGTDESSFATVCVHLHPKWVEATDRFQLCRWRLKTGLEKPVLVRQSAIKHVTQLGMTEFAETEGWIHFRNGRGLELACRRYLEDYPDLSSYVKPGGETTSLPKGMAEAAERAETFSAEDKDNNRVKVHIKAGRVTVTGEGVSGGYLETKKTAYKGPELVFWITPSILADIVRKHNECEVSDSLMRVNGGAYVYVAWLHKPEAAVGASKEESANET